MPSRTDKGICPPDKCTGCAACVNACPAHCLSLREDVYGELHPYVISEQCTNCGLCSRACPNNAHLSYQMPGTCYAAWITDRDKRAACASGGVGTVIAEYVIGQKKGVVVGTAYDDKLVPRTICIERLEDVEALKGSKYVQSVISSDLFIAILKFLKQGRFVAYIGTPCQIAGLKTFLQDDHQNLLTVDLICHGACPTSYFTAEVNYIIKKHGFSNISNVRFRGNDSYDYCLTLFDRVLRPRNRTNYCLSLWQKTLNGVELKYSADSTRNGYLKGFLDGTTLRESCYSCNYARPDRISDITIGDFIGLGSNAPFEYDKENVSSVTLNSEKGMAFYELVSRATPTLMNVRRDYSERLKYKPSLMHPFRRHELNAKFRRLFPICGYEVAIKKTLRGPMLRQRMGMFLNRTVRFPYDVLTKTIRAIKARDLRA